MMRRLTAIAVAFLAVAAACGGDDAPRATTPGSGASTQGNSSGGSGSIDACGLVTKDEVQATTGKRSKDPEARPGINTGNPNASGTRIQDSRCNFNDADGGTLLVQIEWSKSKDSAANYDSLRKLASAAAEDVPGVGDKAYYAVGAVLFSKGDSLVTVSATSAMTDAKVAQQLPELAKKAAARVK